MVNPEWRLSDLSPEQREAFSRLTGEQRVKIACEMSDDLREAAFARIRAEHPDWIDREVKVEFIRQSFFPDGFPPAMDRALRGIIEAERRALGKT